MLAAFKGALSTLTGMDCEERNESGQRHLAMAACIKASGTAACHMGEELCDGRMEQHTPET